MPISRAMADQMERSSWIRRMFEAGVQLRRERGVENVFDFSIGNPDVEPPEAVLAADFQFHQKETQAMRSSKAVAALRAAGGPY